MPPGEYERPFISSLEVPSNLRDPGNQAEAAAYFTKPFGGSELLQPIGEQIPAARDFPFRNAYEQQNT